MDEASNNQTCGNSQQRNPHPRPFFYVQPPSQPYFVYQPWQLNPYSQGLPPGFNYAPRPCMMPYQYMQYPSFMFPQAPMYMMDQRRMFEPRFHAPSGVDAPRHQHHPQPPGRQETACSEAQTDPSAAIAKLIECLDKIRVNELQQSAVRDRELDSGVASQSSRLFSPEDEKKNEVEGCVPTHGSCPHAPVMPFGDSGAALAPYESSRMVLERQGCWSGELEEEPPIDSSSIHEEGRPDLEQSATEERFIFFEKDEVPDVPSDVSATEPSVPKCDAEVSEPSISSSQPELQEVKSSERVSDAELLGTSLNEAKSDHSYQILRLPLDSVCGVRSSAGASPYYYNYHVSVQKTAHERMSVLSPSLDEMSSRDEMFSTDLDDVDLFPRRVLPGRSTGQAAEVEDAEKQQKAWSQRSKRRMCACCGKRLPKATSRKKAHGYQDEAADSDSDSRYEQKDLARKHPTPRRPHPLPGRHAAKPRYTMAQHEEPTDPATNQQGYDVREPDPAEGELAEMDSSDLQCGSCEDRLCRNEPTISEHPGGSIPRMRPTTPLPRQETIPQWKMMYHGSRDGELQSYDEPAPIIWERICKTGGEPR